MSRTAVAARTLRPALALPLLCAALALARPLGAAEPAVVAPPWQEAGTAPLPDTVMSAVVLKEDEAIHLLPRPDSPRRGSVFAGARLPVYGLRSGPGCAAGRWLLVGPLAWICRSNVELSEAPPLAAFETPREPPDGLPFRYHFVGRGGSAAYARVDFADEAEPDMELQPGFAVALVGEKVRSGQGYGLTHHGLWVPMRDLVPVRPFAFHGEELGGGALDVAWVLDDRTPTFTKPDGGARGKETRGRLTLVKIVEESKKGDFVRAADGAWLRTKDVRRPSKLAPPKEVAKGERWIDVELAQQTLVAYQGETPVFATVVSTGKGAQGTANQTPKGTFRIWVKLRSSTMDNLEDEGASSTWAIEDVPYVQFFSKGVALHGAFWHQGFGRVRSHGCVNLAPRDAQRVFAFTGPNLPAGWSAALPTEFERGTVVNVR